MDQLKMSNKAYNCIVQTALNGCINKDCASWQGFVLEIFHI